MSEIRLADGIIGFAARIQIAPNDLFMVTAIGIFIILAILAISAGILHYISGTWSVKVKGFMVAFWVIAVYPIAAMGSFQLSTIGFVTEEKAVTSYIAVLVLVGFCGICTFVGSWKILRQRTVISQSRRGIPSAQH